ncbi:unnamed protein product [Zymoseptoria tritici ST99CH_1A5]|uniref:Metallo-beta-lactamase domain-containing protein n=1 Tax=Zymoseptoria tritici ST99CH_1A5 TaxID=1276529 RepID=A0A1Y6LQZ8_ZYMTR|nr:unnamed protein product [Zymoseptoria tritici ST99CH_1A5]
MPPPASLSLSFNRLICSACGTQFPSTADQDSCRICDDPRQFVPPTGQKFTTLRKLKDEGCENVWWQDEVHSEIWNVKTEPAVGIGQRAILIQTPVGNILWDLITYLDQPTISKIQTLGGLAAIVISHPHYYATWSDWSRTFHCPIYVAKADEEWLECVSTPGAELRFLTERKTEVLQGSGATAIIAGGHFDGSLLLHWKEVLMVADTVIMAPSALNPVPGKEGVVSFGFYWSIPNRIPLPPDEILRMWKLVKGFEFYTAMGAFKGMDVRTVEGEKERGTGDVKGRLLQSCKIQVKAMGWTAHEMLAETME